MPKKTDGFIKGLEELFLRMAYTAREVKEMKKLLKFLFSRYALSAVFILAELVLLIYFLFYGYNYSGALVILTGIIDVLVIISLINRETNPEFKLTWLAVVTMLPVVGGALYIIFSQRRLTRREARLLSGIADGLLENKKSSLDEERSLCSLGRLSEKSELGGGRALSILKDDGLASLYSDCPASYYDSGEKFFEALLDRIKSAEKYIFLEYFIVEDGALFRRIHKELVKKAKAGVEVRLLYDDIGSMNTLPKGFDKRMRSEGISCYRFARVTARLTSSHNNRDHRKICVIDGKYAFTGGANIADEYTNERVRFGHWKDGGVEVTGDAVRGFTRLFLILYDFTAGSISDYDRFLPPLRQAEKRGPEADGKSTDEVKTLSDEREKDALSQGFVIPFGSGPAPAYREPVGKNILMNIIEMSNRYLYVTTPYLIIDYELTEALKSAAKRGVDVRIITPHIPDKKLIKIMTKGSYSALLGAGVRIFEYTPGFIHEKLVVCDDICAVSGTINFDYRSLVHHFEDGLWLFMHPEIIKMRSSFLKTEDSSHEILKEDAKLGPFEKIVKDLVKIFAPLL